MNEQAKAARRAYKREWAKQNPEKVKAQQERYWTKKAAAAADAQGQTQKNRPAEAAAN